MPDGDDDDDMTRAYQKDDLKQERTRDGACGGAGRGNESCIRK